MFLPSRIIDRGSNQEKVLKFHKWKPQCLNQTMLWRPINSQEEYEISKTICQSSRCKSKFKHQISKCKPNVNTHLSTRDTSAKLQNWETLIRNHDIYCHELWKMTHHRDQDNSLYSYSHIIGNNSRETEIDNLYRQKISIYVRFQTRIPFFLIVPCICNKCKS